MDVPERHDRRYLLRRSADLGPVFKGLAWDDLCICIIGLDRCRKLTKEHASDMNQYTIELEQLIPKGFLSAMGKDDHRHYRTAVQSSLKNILDEEGEIILSRIATEGLRSFATNNGVDGDSSEAFSSAMSGIATSMLAWLFFGAQEGTRIHAKILAHFAELGPYGLVWNPQQRQDIAFRAFRDDMHEEAGALKDGTSELSPNGMLGRMISKGVLDETLLGNLIYQAEMGRSDIKNFFRWLTRHVADDPSVLDRIRTDESNGMSKHSKRSLAGAFVVETLRTDQSERLIRRAINDFVFEGMLIPKNALIRLCLWESHHDPQTFPDPHAFDSGRFTNETPTRSQFAPFGVDNHQCPFGDPVIRIGTIFVRAMASRFDLTPIAEGPPVRGGYHWEPAPHFSVQLRE
jgi:cytochrome P450